MNKIKPTNKKLNALSNSVLLTLLYAALLVTSSIAPFFISISKASATGSDQVSFAVNIPTFGSSGSGVTDTKYETISCSATLNKAASIDFFTPSGHDISKEQNSVEYNDFGITPKYMSASDAQAAKDIFKATQDHNNYFETISFKGDSDCSTILFVQSKPGSSRFYGLIPATANINFGGWILAKIWTDVNSDGTFSFKNPATNKNTAMAVSQETDAPTVGSFILHNYGQVGLGAPTGGTTNAGCPKLFSQITSSSQLYDCIGETSAVSIGYKDPFFVDFATACFGGETFILDSWGGDGEKAPKELGGDDLMKYSLSSNFDNRCGKEGDPNWYKSNPKHAYLEVAGLNLTGTNESALKKFKQNLMGILNSSTIRVIFHDINGFGEFTPEKGKNKIYPTFTASNMRIVANYYGASAKNAPADTISPVMGSPKGNEKLYDGTYSLDPGTPSGSGKYIFQNKSVGGSCVGNEQLPFFSTFGVDLTKGKVNDAITANWTLTDNTDKNCQTSVTLSGLMIRVAADSVKPPPITTGGGTACTDNSDNNCQKDTPTCESSGFSLSWIVCSIINGLQDAVGNIYDNVIVPLLTTKPITDNTKSNQKVYDAWSSFRILANIILVIALMIIVFGESLGGGLIDAYTAKKALPKLLAAAILINLSYYLAAIMIDVTNVLGTGLLDLLTKPFSLSGGFSITINGASSAGLIAGLGAAVIWGAMSGALLGFLWAFILVPVFLISIAVVLVVLLRNALIIFLVIISPVAFALYSLPNTEKYFKKWWDAFVETLMVFPIIAALFAIGKIGAFLISNAGITSNFAPGVVHTIAGIFSVIALFAPLALIPYAFKMAGGVIGRASEAVMGAQSKLKEKSAAGMKERIKREQLNNRTQARQKMYTALQSRESRASAGGFIRRNTLGRGLRLAAKGVGGYNIDAATSAAQAQVAKEINDQIASGKDSEPRGLTVNKDWALKKGIEGEDWKIDGVTGKRQFRSAGGAWVDEAAVDAAHARWGKNVFAQQAALSYEMRKANTDEDRERLTSHFDDIADGWKMNAEQRDGAWTGASFENQNNNLQFKYWRRNKETGERYFDHKGFVGEVYEKRGSYPMSQMDATTINRLTESVGKDGVDQDHLRAIAETMRDRMSGARGRAGAAEITPTGEGGTAEPTGASLGAGHVSEAMNRFVGRVLGGPQS